MAREICSGTSCGWRAVTSKEPIDTHGGEDVGDWQHQNGVIVQSSVAANTIGGETLL